MVRRMLSRIAIGLLFLVVGAVAPAGAQAWPNGYGYRSTITIDHTKVPNSDQTNFPVLISGTYASLATTANGGYVTNANGHDIIFASDGAGSNVLPSERESYNATTGAVAFWVQVPTLSHSADTVLYMFFGNSSITTDQSNKTAVWDSNYKGVWHLPNGSTLSGADSTSNAFNLGNNNSTGATSGKIGGAASFNGSNNYLSNSSLTITSGSSITISFWEYVPSADVKQGVTLSIGGSDNPNRIVTSAPWSDSTLYWDYGSYSAGGRISTSLSSYLNSWTHVVLEYNLSTSQHLIYLNGSLAASSTNSNAPTSTQTGIWAGVWTPSNGYYFEGTLDELRVSTSARSGDWIAAEYNNQNSPSSFYSIGSAQSGNGTPTISSLSPSSGPVGTSIVVTGTNFGSSQGSSTVTFNGTTATPTAWTFSSIVVPVPVGGTSGNIVVKVSGVSSNGTNFTVTPGPTPSWSNGYSYRSAITIDHTKVPNTDQTNFPVLISGTDANLATTGNGGLVTSSSGYDIIFTSDAAGSTELPFERESYNASTGSVVYWVQVPTLSHSVDTIVYMFFGNSSVTTDQSNKTGVWDSNYKGVWHFNQTPSGSGSIKDSTSNGFDGTPASSGISLSSGGITGSALSFSGTSLSNNVSMSSSLPGGAPLTASIWIKTSGLNGSSASGIMDKGSYPNDGWDIADNGQYSSVVMFRPLPNVNAAVNIPRSTVNTGTWHYLVGTVDSANNIKFYLDGSLYGSTSTATVTADTSDPLTIGSFAGNAGGGLLTEARVSNSARPADWIAAEYNNQNSPSTFYGIGSAQIGSTTPPAISSLSPSATGVGNAVTISGANFGSTQGSSTVTFNGIATVPSSWSASSVVAPVPSGASTGYVVATVGGISSNSVLFTLLPTPTISALSSTSGPTGIPITITGTNFGSTQGSSTITFNGTSATVTSWSATSIQTSVPSGVTTGNVVVTVSGVASAGTTFTVTNGPGILSLSPNAGLAGTYVTITGENFGPAQGSSTVSYSGTNVSVISWSNTSIVAPVPTGASTGSFVVTVAGQVSNGVTFTITPLPPGWSHTDIGSVGTAGSANFSNGTFTVSGSGTMQGTADSLHFVYQTLSGDGTIVARLVSVSGGSSPQAGIIIRETLGAGSSTAATGNQQGAEYIWYRASTGASLQSQSLYTGQYTIAPPCWMKLVRSGNNFTAYFSWDAEVWSQVGSTQTISMAQNVYVGLFVASNTSTLATAKFDNVSINSSVAPAPALTNVAPGGGPTGTHVVLSGSGFGAVQQSGLVTLNGTSLAVTSWSDTLIVATVPSGATTGPMAVLVAPFMNASNPEAFAVGSQLLSSWTDADVPDYHTGTASYSNGIFSISGGSYTYGGANYLFQPLSGDGTIVARVLSASGAYSKTAGVMIRQTMDGSSPYAYMSWATGSAAFTTVTQFSNGSLNTQGGGSFNLPGWVKLVRSGNTFTGYVSADGQNWFQVGYSVAIDMPTNALIGLASQDLDAPTTVAGTFDNVSITTDSSQAPVLASLSATTGPVGTQVTLTGAGFGASQGSSIAWIGSSTATVNSWSDTSVTITIPTGATSGPISISVAPSMNESNAIFFTVTSNPLPSPWLDSDVGTVGIAGSATYSGSTFTMNASGAYIGSSADQMHYVFQPWSGDGTIVARVSGLSGGYNPQAGVMIRESLNAGSPNAFVGIQGSASSAGTYFWYRSSVGTYTNYAGDQYPATITVPNWVKLVRSGNTFTAYESADGVTWGQVGSTQTIPMGQEVYIGLALSAYTNSSLATATFDNVCIQTANGCSSSQAPQTAPSVFGVLPSTGGVDASVVISGSDFGSTQGTSTVTFNGTPAYVVAWDNWQIIAVVPTLATSGSVVVTVGSQPSNSDLTYTVIQPKVSSVAPVSAPTGGTMTLTGSGFGSSQGNSYVLFSGTNSGSTVTSWSDTSITTTVPSSAVTGPLQVIVGGVFSNTANVIVTGSLSVTSISPGMGMPGSSVTIQGTGFGATQGSGTVAFDGTVATVTNWSNTSITATVGSGTLSGLVSVTVAGLTAYGPNFNVNGQTLLTDSLGNQTTYTSVLVYGQWLVSHSNGPGCSTCTLRGTTTNQFDGTGNLTSITDPRGYTTSYGYDSLGELTSVTQPSVSAGTPTITYTYDSLGDVLTATDPLGHVTTNTYDTKGNLLTVTTPAPATGVSASVTHFAYNGLGELTSITDPLSHVWTVTYTSTGLIHTITDPQSNVTTYAYDSRGNRTSITDAMSHVTSFTYDMGNRLTQIAYPDSTTTSFTYDSRGRRTSVTDQNGKTTSYAYDDADRLTSVTDPASNVTTYGYDTESNLTSITDANSHTTAFTYDAFGRVTKTTFPSSYYETYGYDADNNLTSKTDRNGHTIDYVYDALNRLTSKSYPDTTQVEYTYDLVGKLMGVTDPSGTYGFSYDNMGRLTGTTANYSFLSGTTFTNAYTYDAGSNRTGYTAPDGSTNTYSYDTLNRLTSLANSATGTFGFSYDALNRRTQMTRPNGINTNYSYDNLSRLLSVLHQSGTSTIDGATYTLDNAGNRTAKTDDLANVTTNYGYDSLYQLLSATQGGTTTESYSYDPVGNRTASLGVSSYTTNSSNEMTANSNASYTYDYNGNTTSKTDSSGTTNYSWDYENRLTSVALPGNVGTVSFKYDPFGRRIEKISSTATTIFISDGDNLVETTNGSGTEVVNYVHGDTVDEPLAMRQAATNDYFNEDGLGSVTSIADSTGSIVQSYTYGSFGRTTASGSLVNSLQFASREFDSEIGLYFNRARYFDPASGRFLSEDPLGLRLGGDRYVYVSNAPTDATDPSGLCKISVGHHAVMSFYCSALGGMVPVEHTYIVLGEPGVSTPGQEPWVLDAQPSGLICPWCNPTLEAAAGPLAAGLDETNGVARDGTPLLVTADDGRPCALDQRILDDLANKINGAGVPYHLIGPNSNSVTSTGLGALGFPGWSPPIIAPGWGDGLPGVK